MTIYFSQQFTSVFLYAYGQVTHHHTLCGMKPTNHNWIVQPDWWMLSPEYSVISLSILIQVTMVSGILIFSPMHACDIMCMFSVFRNKWGLDGAVANTLIPYLETAVQPPTLTLYDPILLLLPPPRRLCFCMDLFVRL